MKKYLLILSILFISIASSKSEIIIDNKEVISLIENSWNKINTMSGRFQQTDTDNNIENGDFVFDKPYKARFTYDNKDETIITNKILISVLDAEGYQVDSYPLGNSPIKKILSDEIRFDEIFEIVSIEQIFDQENVYQISATNKDSDNKSGKVLFFFSIDDLTLKKWVIFDEFSNKTVLEFTNIKKNISISQNTFVVKHRY
tara:strand:- start:2851 stop:3453 length:603 start_codon:yes stop_codon:yes gene_type:complete